jgi:hypothetical protein
MKTKSFLRMFLTFALASTAAAQNYPPGTSCFPLSDTPDRCKYSGQNRPPVLTFQVNAGDKRSLELCNVSMLSDEACRSLLGRIRLIATATDPDGDELLFTFNTTGGRIAETGPTAVWDLVGETTGTYVATVEAVDGCGCVASGSVDVTVKPTGPKWLTGVWEGTGYQWDTETLWPMTLSATNSTYKVDYPTLKCGGRWQLIDSSGDTASFKEDITVGVENCAQGETVHIKRFPTGELAARFSHEGMKETNAAAMLKPRPASKKPVRPARSKRSSARPRR